MHKMKKLICKILTFGRHWWIYGPIPGISKYPWVICKICGKLPPDGWLIYEKKFKGKKSGQVKTETKHVFRKRRRK